jgi:hypothetical protein
MKVTNPTTITDLAEAQELAKSLTLKLLDCERYLDDLARAAEISIMTGQPHLLNSFVDTANEYLTDRLDLEVQEEDIVTTILPA